MTAYPPSSDWISVYDMFSSTHDEYIEQGILFFPAKTLITADDPYSPGFPPGIINLLTAVPYFLTLSPRYAVFEVTPGLVTAYKDINPTDRRVGITAPLWGLSWVSFLSDAVFLLPDASQFPRFG